MPRFFVSPESISGSRAVLRGEDAAHASRSLRMRVGEPLVLCDGAGTDYRCVISSLSADTVELTVESREQSKTEPSVRVTVYQGYPKGDKLEFVIEKSVELGASEIVPVMMSRSVARPDEKSAAKKHERWQRHSLEAAKQCGRGCIPSVSPLISFTEMTARFSRHDVVLFCYERGGQPLKEVLSRPFRSAAFIIGPEGGFDDSEAERLISLGAAPVTLGSRILRTETAAVAALAAIMYESGNLGG